MHLLAQLKPITWVFGGMMLRLASIRRRKVKTVGVAVAVNRVNSLVLQLGRVIHSELSQVVKLGNLLNQVGLVSAHARL